MARLNRGELAQAAGVGIESLRYYERRGLLPKPPRTASNYRRYPDESIQRVRFIKGAQALGFSLDEVSELLRLRAHPTRNCEPVLRQAREKVIAIDEKLRALSSVKRALLFLMENCSGDQTVNGCTILDAIETGPSRARAGSGQRRRRTEVGPSG